MTDYTHQKDFETIEAHLAGTLKRVSAPRDMFHRLYDRIQIPTRSEIQLRLSDWRRLVFVFSGVMSGMLLLVTVARMFYYFVGRKG
jgi:hypothetical protein